MIEKEESLGAKRVIGRRYVPIELPCVTQSRYRIYRERANLLRNREAQSSCELIRQPVSVSLKVLVQFHERIRNQFIVAKKLCNDGSRTILLVHYERGG